MPTITKKTKKTRQSFTLTLPIEYKPLVKGKLTPAVDPFGNLILVKGSKSKNNTQKWFCLNYGVDKFVPKI